MACTCLRRPLFVAVLCILLTARARAFSFFSLNCHNRSYSLDKDVINYGRRDLIRKGLFSFLAPTVTLTTTTTTTAPCFAYTPDSDALRESLYLICRVQEATCLQERYIQKKLPPIQKMKLTLRLVDKSYRVLDQINYVSKYIPPDDLVAAVQAGNEAADSLQDAIDFVYSYNQKDGESMTHQQKEFLIDALTDTREKLFDFCSFLPDQDKLRQARQRVEEENKLNQDEFDPDLANDAGVYNPIELPWKNQVSR